MPHPNSIALLLSLLSLLASHTAYARKQSGASRENNTASAQQVTIDPGLIGLNVVVIDPSGKPLPGLTGKDFTLLDNGQPRKILSFRPFEQPPGQPQAPVELIFLIDGQDKPGYLIAQEENAVETFLRAKGGRTAEPVSLYTLLPTGLWQIAAPSTDGNALASQIAHHHPVTLVGGPGGIVHGQMARFSPDFTDPPLLIGLKALGQIATEQRRNPGRKLLLWIGPDAHSGLSGAKDKVFALVCWLSTLLREAQVTLYTFAVGETGPLFPSYKDYLGGVASPKQVTVMNLNPKVLAVQSGGRALDASYDLVPTIESCVEGAGAFYRLSFNPPLAGHPDEYHALEIKIAAPGAIARSSTGYYDQPYYSNQPEPNTRFVTVQQLTAMVDALHGQGDAKAASQLSSLQLTQRLSDSNRTLLDPKLPGKRSRQALVALADASVFLSPPADDASAHPPPDAAAQRHMISLAADYLRQTMPKLPDFFAGRTTVRYQETAHVEGFLGAFAYQPLHPVETFKEAVLYRNGQELAQGGKHRQRSAADPFLVTYGTFGPALFFVHDAIASPQGLTWSRWENDLGGVRAVFHYAVSSEKSRFQFAGCCLPDGDGNIGFSVLAGYHGEIAIDPRSGAVLRVQAEADMGSTTLVDHSAIMIDYGPVQIGGKSYICPLRSVSLMRLRSVITQTEWDEGFKTFGPYLTMVNDIRYENYHMYHGESRLLPGYETPN